MDCANVIDQLVAYHLALVSSDDRDAIEAHLGECHACVKTYLAIKRAADRPEPKMRIDERRPRPAVKARLRAEVARAFPPPERAPRRIPLYQGFALAALAAAIALVAPDVVDRARRSSARSEQPAMSIDTARTKAESLHIY